MILIADRNNQYCKLHESLLESQSYVICKAKTVSHLLKILFANKIELLVLDIQFAIELKALELVRPLKCFDDIPIIVLSDSYSEQSINKSYQMGANAYIEKPVSNMELLSAVKFFLQDVTFKNPTTT